MENKTITHEYSTQKETILFKEYGRNIHMLAEYVQAIEDKEERSKRAHSLVELMRIINPSLRDTNEYYQKIWDHLYHMTDLKLEVDTEFEKPKETIAEKSRPQKLEYSSNRISFKHYGKNVELLIQKAIEEEDEKEKFDILIYTARLMKKFYTAWNRDNVEDTVIAKHIHQLSKGEIELDLEKVKEENLLYMPGLSSRNHNNNNSHSNNNNRHRNNNYKKNTGNNNRKHSPKKKY
ncbi:MAG: DUF4290 domain-containing protein [Cyclobacteriaceae bacterium]